MKVLFIQKTLTHFRIPFFLELKKELEKENIILELVYGKLKNDNRPGYNQDLEWGKYKPIKIFRLGTYEFYYQGVLNLAKNYDLVITEHADRIIDNHLMLFFSKIFKFRFAYIGHGENRTKKRNSFSNLLKLKLVSLVDFYFAYTNSVRNYLIENGIDKHKIISFNNTINEEDFSKYYMSISEKEIEIFLNRHNLTSTDNIGLYIGGFYKEKCLDFLIEASKIIRKNVPNFQLIISGSGEEEEKIKKASHDNTWITFLPPQFLKDKALLFKISKVLLMPGLVGLVVVDSFNGETPIITTKNPFHSPEVDYIINFQNGIITDFDKYLYAKKVEEVLSDNDLYQTLISGCKKSKVIYTLDNMVERFNKGIIKALMK